MSSNQSEGGQGKVSIVKCPCGDSICKTYGLSDGTFNQGNGWSKERAQEYADAINSRNAPIAAFNGDDKWQYIETKCAAAINVNDKYRIEPHWGGLGDGDEIRRIIKLASSAPQLYAALEKLIPIALRLQGYCLRGKTINFDNYDDEAEAVKYAQVIDDANSALASARGEGEGKLNDHTLPKM